MIRKFLRSDFHLKVEQEDPTSPNSEAEFVILTCQLACLQDDFKIRKRQPTEAQV